jgi:hypothetical protein
MSINTQHAAIRFLKMAKNQTQKNDTSKKENPLLYPLSIFVQVAVIK